MQLQMCRVRRRRRRRKSMLAYVNPFTIEGETHGLTMRLCSSSDPNYHEFIYARLYNLIYSVRSYMCLCLCNEKNYPKFIKYKDKYKKKINFPKLIKHFLKQTDYKFKKMFKVKRKLCEISV